MQNDFAPMRVCYMRQGKAFVLVYSIDDRASFEEIELLYYDLTRTIGKKEVPIIVCGNKCDLEDRKLQKVKEVIEAGKKTIKISLLSE